MWSARSLPAPHLLGPSLICSMSDTQVVPCAARFHCLGAPHVACFCFFFFFPDAFLLHDCCCTWKVNYGDEPQPAYNTASQRGGLRKLQQSNGRTRACTRRLPLPSQSSAVPEMRTCLYTAIVFVQRTLHMRVSVALYPSSVHLHIFRDGMHP